MTRLGSILRAPALVAAGSLFVHEGRYLAGYGGHSHDAQAEQGHAYVTAALVPTIGALAGLAFVALLVAFFRAMRDLDPAPRPVRFAPAWIGATLALQVIYTSQELLEGYFAAGHPPGIAGVLGHGGWTAYAIALVVGALVALLLRGAAAVVRWAASRAPRRTLAPAAVRRLTLPSAPDAVPLAPLARGDAGRAPPSFA